jgi:formylglycine-generating enzyme required for sulfatase activity
MRFRHVAVAALLCWAATVASAQPATGSIDLRAGPGIAVWLDGAFAGITDGARGGLLLGQVPAGARRLEMDDGAARWEVAVEVASDAVAAVVLPGARDGAVPTGGGLAPTFVSVANVRLLPLEAGVRAVALDVGWPEGWFGAERPSYVEAADAWDAAWLFVKFRVADGPWRHGTLRGADAPTGALAAAPAGVAIDVPADGKGAFVRRDAPGAGAFVARDLRLAWDAAADGVATEEVEVAVHAVEMVFVPEGPFVVGSGGAEEGAFRLGAGREPFPIAAQGPIPLGGGNDQLNWTPGTAAGVPAGRTHPDFPTGYAAFYVMRHQISLGQYVNFLNALTPAQADARRLVGATAHYDVGRDASGGFTTRLPHVAASLLSWADGAAFADWAGLRPLTELEYEKAARGPRAPVAGEFAWGSTRIVGPFGLADAGTLLERPIPTIANANYLDHPRVRGPVRVGSFAAAGKSREQAGAGYTGALELSGNLWERVVTVGNAEGRAFTGAHGDGELDGAGDADAPSWPDASAAGAGFRGGDWVSPEPVLRASDRAYAAYTRAYRHTLFGWRGARSAP